MNPERPRVVVCGAGVVGAAVAYYLSLRGVCATVVERCNIACAASGKAGGFLAFDWCDGSLLAELARVSFKLHDQLARTLDGDYGYRRLTTLAVASGAEGRRRSRREPDEISWLDGPYLASSVLGTTATTAQVHPKQFTQTLLEAAMARGSRFLIGCVEGVALTRGRVHGVRVDGQILACDAVVIAMGPWSGLAARWLPLPPVSGLKGHSITLRPKSPISAHALFVDYVDNAGQRYDPEVYPRPDGEVYLCGLSDTSPVPENPEHVQPRPGASAVLQQIAGSLSSSLNGLEPLCSQACYRPVCDDGLPMIGKVPGVGGAYVATGHNCWGILNAPATGLVMSELIVDGHARSVDLSPFDPKRDPR